MRRPFFIFALVVTCLVVGILTFIQSAPFAGVLKSVAARYLPQDLGVGGDFSEIAVQLFPPGFSLKNPKLWVKERNPIRLPGGSRVEARRIDFTFRPFQIFSGDIRFHQVTIVDGELRLAIDPTQQRAAKPSIQSSSANSSHRFRWEELFRIRADGVALENVQILLGPLDEASSLQGVARSARLSRSEDRSTLAYDLELELNQVQGKWLTQLSIPGPTESLRAKARVSASGVEIQQISLSQPGFSLEILGHLRGDILNLQNKLEADLAIKANGDLRLVSSEFQRGKKGPLPQGRLMVDGTLQGNMLSPMETLRLAGSIEVDDFKYQAWHAQLFQAKLRWDASPAGGEIILERGVVSSPLSPRSGSEHPGEGGRVEFGPVRWEVSSQRPLSVPVKLEQAHLHWLAAPAVESIYPLDFRLNGETQLVFKPQGSGRSWELQADLKNWLEGFQLDNQQYRKPKPLSTVFQIPKIFLAGQLLVDPTGIRPNHLDVSLPHSVLHLNGKLDFKKGYDLNATGSLDLEDLGRVASNEIRGKGEVSVHVHGAPVAVLVDIDLDVKGGSYLNLALGSIQGRITWDDPNNRLIFSKADLHHGETQYFVDGFIDVGANDRANLDVRVPSGNIQDFIQIFSRLTGDLSWFPHSLNGPFEGALKVRGGLSFPRLIVSSEIDGRDWEFFGERFKTVHLTGGYDRGKYEIEALKALKRTGEIDASVSVEDGRQIQWKVETHHFTVLDFDHVAQSDVPFRGDMKFRSEGRGSIDQVESSTEWNLSRFSVRGIQMASSTTALTTQGGVARWIGSYFGGQAEVSANYDANSKNLSSIHAVANQLDFSPLLLLINKKNMQDSQLAGLLSGEMDLRFRAGAIEKANGSVQISDYLLACTDVRFQLDHPVAVAVADGNFEVAQLTIASKSKKATLDLRNKNDLLEGRIQGELDDSWVYFFLPSVTQVRGASILDFVIGGSIKEPSIEGEARLNGGDLRVEALESPLENLAGTIQIKQNEVIVKNIRSDLGGGRVSVNGTVLLSGQKPPVVALKVALQENKIKVYPFQYAKLSGQLGIRGTSAPYLIDGNIAIDSALSREKMLNQKRASDGFKAVQYLPSTSAKGEAPTSSFKLNISLETPHGVLVQNDLFRDVVAQGKMTLVNTLDTPRVLGRMEVTQGKLIFKDHVFHIQSASALFDSPTVMNPSFDLMAHTEANGVKIQMFATGRKSDMKIEMTSNPSMQESEIFSLLALGLTSSDAKKLSATDLGYIQQGEAASLVLHSLDFNRELEDRTGFQVLVDESVNTQQGVSAFRPQAQNETGAAPQITIKKKFGDRFSVSAGSTMGFGSSKSNQINLDYSVSSDLSVNGVLSNYGSNVAGATSGAATDAQASQTQNSFGLDLKFITRFK